MMATRVWSLASDVAGVATAMITPRAMPALPLPPARPLGYSAAIRKDLADPLPATPPIQLPPFKVPESPGDDQLSETETRMADTSRKSAEFNLIFWQSRPPVTFGNRHGTGPIVGCA